MSRYISKKDRIFVSERAFHLCEYCLLHDSQSFFGFEIEHILSIKHGGGNSTDNLAYSCLNCNQFKGSDLGTVLLPSTKIIRFFNPRIDKWSKHFELVEAEIQPKTKIGASTIKILQFNQVDRLLERAQLIDANWYPHPLAIQNILS